MDENDQVKELLDKAEIARQQKQYAESIFLAQKAKDQAIVLERETLQPAETPESTAPATVQVPEIDQTLLALQKEAEEQKRLEEEKEQQQAKEKEAPEKPFITDK